MVVFGCLWRDSHFALQDQRGLKVKKRIVSSVHAGIATPFPVRAGMVVDPAQYRWSSYRADGLNQPVARLTPHALYLATDAQPATRRQAYRALFRPQLDGEAASNIREALRLGMPLGSQRFAETVCARGHTAQQRQAGTSTRRSRLAASASGRTTGFRILDDPYAKRKTKCL
jgi:hypothetical protein